MKISITKILTIVLGLALGLGTSSEAWAKKKRKFKGVIIVNQILKLTGTATRNGEPAPEFSGVKDGDLIETQAKSAAVIRVVGLGIFRLDADSALKLSQFTSRDNSRFEVSKGVVTFLFERQGSHSVLTPNGRVTNSAARFTVRATKGEIDEIFLISGKLTAELRLPGIAIDAKARPKSAKEPQLSADTAGAPQMVQGIAMSEGDVDQIVTVSKLQGVNRQVGKLEGEQLLVFKNSKVISEMESLYSLP